MIWRRWSFLLAGLLAAARLVTPLGSFAPVAEGSSSFTPERIDLEIGVSALPLTLAGMAPGDVVTRAIAVRNQGRVPIRYTMTTTTEGSRVLARSLTVSIDAGRSDCSLSQPGAPLYAGHLSGATLAPGPSGGRTVDGGSEDLLCLRVILPLEGSDALQASDTTATFTFHAEQSIP